MMELAIGVVFGMVFLLVPIWFWLIHRLNRQVKAADPERHRQLRFDELLPGGVVEAIDHDNTGAVTNLARFLWHKEYLALGDSAVTRTATWMRGFAVIFLGGMGLIGVVAALGAGFA